MKNVAICFIKCVQGTDFTKVWVIYEKSPGAGVHDALRDGISKVTASPDEFQYN